MCAGSVNLADDVEKEGLDVVVERLVVEEELGKKAEVLGVDALSRGGGGVERARGETPWRARQHATWYLGSTSKIEMLPWR